MTLDQIEAVRLCLNRERCGLERDGERLEVFPWGARRNVSEGAYHMIEAARLSPESTDGVIAEQIAHCRSLGAAVEWKVYDFDPPADLRERLAGAGWSVGEAEAVMVLDLESPPEWVSGADDRIAVRRVADKDDLAQFREVAETVSGRSCDHEIRELEAALRTGSHQSCGYLAFVDGEPASVGRLYTHPQSAFGGLYGGRTRERFRSRGCYRALVVARARDARSWGCRYLIVDALPTSRPILERMGFCRIGWTWPCEWRP